MLLQIVRSHVMCHFLLALSRYRTSWSDWCILDRYTSEKTGSLSFSWRPLEDPKLCRIKGRIVSWDEPQGGETNPEVDARLETDDLAWIPRFRGAAPGSASCFPLGTPAVEASQAHCC
jgi:hypothetical protein